MRKIEKLMLQAIEQSKPFKLDNTEVLIIGNIADVFLHGNNIATIYNKASDPRNRVMINIDTLRKWPSNTTKSRLRALGADVTTKKHVTYYNGEAI